MTGKNENRSPGTQKNGDGKLTNRKDILDLTKIAEQSETSQKKQKKTQEEFLFQYIKQF